MPAPIKGRLIPFKVLATLLYAEQAWCLRDGQITEIFTGPMARAMRISNSRLHEVLKELEQLGYLRIHAYPIGRIYCVVAPPPGLQRLSPVKATQTAPVSIMEKDLPYLPTTTSNGTGA